MNEPAKNDPETLTRVRLVIQVQSGQIAAKEGATRMGVSRKTYYKWERRCLRAMMAALQEKDSGRPSIETDPEKEGLRQEIEELKKELLLLEQRLHVRDVLTAATDPGLDREKKG